MAQVPLEGRIDGARALIRRLGSYRRRVGLVAVPRAIDRISADLLQRSRALAPILTGDLIRSSGVGRRVRNRRGVSVPVLYRVPYADKVHENMVPAPGATLQPGPLTRQKPRTADGKPGGLFLSRPFRRNSRRYLRLVEREIRLEERR